MERVSTKLCYFDRTLQLHEERRRVLYTHASAAEKSLAETTNVKNEEKEGDKEREGKRKKEDSRRERHII